MLFSTFWNSSKFLRPGGLYGENMSQIEGPLAYTSYIVPLVNQIFLHYLKELGEPLTRIKELAQLVRWHAYPGYIFR